MLANTKYKKYCTKNKTRTQPDYEHQTGGSGRGRKKEVEKGGGIKRL